MPAPYRLTRRHAAAGLLAFASGLSFVLPKPGKAAQGTDEGMNEPDGTYLIVTGEDLMPTVPVRWRIISQTAKPVAEAPELARTLNFLLPVGDTPIHVANLTTGEDAYLPVHVAAAAFGAEGDVQKRYVEADEPAPYVAFELIVADQDTPATIGTGTWLGATDAFTAPEGIQAMELVALVVNDDEGQDSIAVPEVDPGLPLIGYVHNRPVVLERADGSEVALAPGEVVELTTGDVVHAGGEPGSGNALLCFARFTAQRTY